MSTIATTRVRPEVVLSPEREADKRHHEAVVTRHIGGTIECITSLHHLKENKDYYADFLNFDEYAKTMWGVGKSQYHRLVRAAEVFEELPDDLPKPTTESRLRPLTLIPASEREPAYREAVASAGGEVPTVAQVEAATAKRAPLRSKVRPSDPVERARSNGIIPQGAEVSVETPDPAPDASPFGDAKAPADDNAMWLDALTERYKLSPRCRELFDVEATAFRTLKPFRDAYRNACAKTVKAVERECNGRGGPWLRIHKLHFLVNDPSDWVACASCDGQGTRPIIGTCPDCFGDGYHTR